MRVLVTGATGFVGRWLSQRLLQDGHEVVGSSGRDRFPISDPGAVRDLVAAVRPDAIAHLAAVSYGPDARRDPLTALETNVGGTAALLQAAALAGVRAILVAGSSEVYDPRTTPPLSEDAPLGPISAYGLTKLAQEAVALEIAGLHGVPIAVTRAFNHTGPGQRPGFVVPALARRVLLAGETGEVRVGNLDVRRDFADVRDVVRAYSSILDGLFGGRLPVPLVVNVGSGRSVSINEILETLIKLAGTRPSIRVDPDLVRPGESQEVRADISRIASLIDWRPEIPLGQTLRDVLAHERSTDTA